MDKKILLLGGTGTLSTSVLHKLLNYGWNVWILNRGHNNNDIPEEVNIIIGDFKKPQQWEASIKNKYFDVVIDFLSREPSDVERLFPIFNGQCTQYIFISSACVYRRAENDFPIKETSPKPNRQWSYNVEKYECEERLKNLYSKSTYYTIVRPYITYDKNRIPYGIAPAYRFHRTIIERILHDKPLFVWNEGETPTTLTYVEEFADGVVGLLLNPKAKNQDFHITTDFVCKVKDILLCLYEELGRKPNIVNIPSDLLAKVMPNYKGMLYGDRMLPAIFDNSKIKDAVPDLQFNTDIAQGIRLILNHYRERKDYSYDYMYEGQIDRMLSRLGIATSYIKYNGADENSYKTYWLYRYIPYRIAVRINRMIKV